MVVLDVAIVNVALPTIKTDLHFSQESLQWVVTAYSILFGGVLLLGGRMADLLGRRRLFMGGLILFTVSSLLDGLAWSSASLITFRALQGLGAALLAPAALSILMTTFTEGRERNLALGIWGAVSGSGAAVGVLLGGALTSALSWSWIFYVNVPVGALVLILTPILLRESRAALDHRHFDVAGASTITSGLMLLVYALTRASQHGWATGTTAGLLAASAALIAAFIVVELRSPAPLLPLRIFKLRTLSGSNAAALAGAVRRDAGVASGLLNTSQQIGGAIGVAIATTIATTYTTRFATHHHVTASSPHALTHGFVVAFYVLAAISIAGSLLSAALVESQPAEVEEEAIVLGEL